MAPGQLREQKQPAPLLQAGEPVDHFRILRLLGRGGMGDVYLARDIKLGRKVALKVVHPKALGKKKTRDRFLAEARLTALFNHPHIVTIYSVGEHLGYPYLALEYLEGENLQQRIERERPAPLEALRIGLAIAEALTEAHHHGVLHRDLKPSNVVLPRDGRLRVLDFGVAMVVDLDDLMARSAIDPDPSSEHAVSEVRDAIRDAPFEWPVRRLAGTPRYMAPEQWDGHQATEATDVWALGVTLFVMLEGKHPFQGGAHDLAARICSGEPAPALSEVEGVPPEVRSLVARCLSKDQDGRPSAQQITATLRQALRHDRPEHTPEHNPFRGLLPFTERHADMFFGREAEIGAFVERLREQTVVAVVGPSGGGKSSFVLAGVIPRLKEQGPWVTIALRPGSQPFRTLAKRLLHAERPTGSLGPDESTVLLSPAAKQRLAQSASDDFERGEREPSADDDISLAEELRAAPGTLSLVLQTLSETVSARVLLFVDQLEELYRLTADEGVRRQFMDAVCRAADDPAGPVRVVLTVREDFLGHVAETPAAREALEHIVVLRSPGPEALQETVTAPAQRLGYRFDPPELPATMVAAVSGEPASLPVLQFACSLLWQHRDRERRVLTGAAYESFGGVEGALARHADDVLEGLTPSQMDLARQVFLRLVSPQRTRQVVARNKLLAGLHPDAGEVLGRLVRARAVLVRKGHSHEEADAKLELVHESLIVNWLRLARWLDESHDERAFLAEVGQAAELWDKRGRREEEVWRGHALQEGLARSKRCAVLPEQVARFLAAGERREARRVLRRRMLIAAVIASLTVVALVLAVMVREARHQRSQAEQERSRAVERHAEAQREGARAAFGRGDLLEARAKLRTSLETRDSSMARALWWRLQQEPAVWTKKLGTWVNAVARTPDGSTIAAGCGNQSVYLFDAETRSGRVLRGHEGQVLAVAFSADGQQLASGGNDPAIRVWSLSGGGAKKLLGHQGAVTGLAWSPRGRVLASGSRDKTVRLWNAETGQEARSLTGHQGAVMRLAFSPDGRMLASASHDHTVRIWDVASGAERAVLEGHDESVVAVMFDARGRLLASGSHDGTARLWDTQTWQTRTVLRGHDGPVRAVSFHPQEPVLATGSTDSTVRLWNLDSGAELRRLVGHTGQIWNVVFGPDGRSLVSGGLDETVRLWDVTVGTGESAPEGHSAAVHGLSFSPDGKVLASGSWDKTVRIWDVATGNVRKVLRGHGEQLGGVTFNRSGTLLASGDGSGTVRLWDGATFGAKEVLRGHERHVLTLDFSPDGKSLASGSLDNSVRLWDIASGASTLIKAGASVWSVAFSPDGRTLAWGGHDEKVHLWDVAKAKELKQLEGHTTTVVGLDFSPDGGSLASAGIDKTIRIWNVETGEGRVLGQHDGPVYWLQFSPSGEQLATPSSDGTARIWDLRSDSAISLHGHRGEVNTIRFSPDGKLVATSSDDGTVRLWQASNGAPIWRAPLLWGDPPELVTHRGWVRLDPSAAAKVAHDAEWRQAVEGTARFAAADESTQLVCIGTHDHRLEIWDTKTDTRASRTELPGLSGLVALDSRCVSLSQGSALLHQRDGTSTKLAADVTAVARGGDRLLVGTKARVLIFDANGQQVGEKATDVGISALGGTQERVLLGFLDGTIEVMPLAADSERPADGKLAFEELPSSPVVSLVEGPRGTIIAGYANGLLGIWSRDDGTRLYHRNLPGPVRHLRLSGQKLHAASELGHHVVLDFEIFHREYCALLQEIWQSVPVVWQGGRPVRRPPPTQGEHRCATGSP